jgi:hypothetical protein
LQHSQQRACGNVSSWMHNQRGGWILQQSSNGLLSFPSDLFEWEGKKKVRERI